MGNERVKELLSKVEQLNEIGVALSSTDDTQALLERILLGAKKLTNADAGSLYSLTEEKKLKFEAIRTDKLDIALGGTTGNEITFPDVELHDSEGHRNDHNVVTYCVLEKRTVNIKDAYTEKSFDFSGTKAFDKQTGYISKSFLTMPLLDHEQNVIGAIQLINRLDVSKSNIIEFNSEDQKLAESLASQAAIALTNKRLIAQQKKLFEDFIQLIAGAIDAKSPYTGGHCSRVPKIGTMIADAMNSATTGKFKDFTFSNDEYYELEIAGWLHDCGKVTTPEYVVDKSTKLETISDRIENVKLRVELVKRENEIKLLRSKLKNNYYRSEINNLNKQITEDGKFLEEVNIGDEFLSKEGQERIANVALTYTYKDSNGKKQPLLSEDEIKNLQISRGTLNNEEREIINNHVTMSLKMLESLTYPKGLENVPDIAGSHHEKLDGTGYPRGLTGDQMSIQAKILAVADVFEALTAADRPYKEAKTLSTSLKILGFMVKDGHIDQDLFQLFIDEGVYQVYADEFLLDKQKDEVDLSKLPGYIQKKA